MDEQDMDVFEHDEEIDLDADEAMASRRRARKQQMDEMRRRAAARMDELQREVFGFPMRLFSEAVGVSGLVLTKLDGTAKGGIALAIASELGIPVKLIGVGEQLEDLRPFEPEEFVRALVS